MKRSNAGQKPEIVEKKSKLEASDLVGSSTELTNIPQEEDIADGNKTLVLGVPNIHEVFADPTFDVTFKMLFGNEQNKDILISLINSLLGFSGEREIIEVEINNSELQISFFSGKKGESGITSAVDILCTNKGKHKIAIEMQGQRTKYFLAREQEYMAKLIAGQVREGEGKLYHERVLETYIIIIGKDNIFAGNTALNNQALFELDVQPVVLQTNQIVPCNKMNWKFFELPKFQASSNYQTINKVSPLKEQWLEFLIDCSKYQEEPDRSEIIKKGYEIMKVATWNNDTKVLYWKQKVNEQDAQEAMKLSEEEAFAKGLEKGREMDQIKLLEGLKKAIEHKIPHDTLVEIFTLFSSEQIKQVEEYMPTNPNFSMDDLVHLLGYDSHMTE